VDWNNRPHLLITISWSMRVAGSFLLIGDRAWKRGLDGGFGWGSESGDYGACEGHTGVLLVGGYGLPRSVTDCQGPATG